MITDCIKSLTNFEVFAYGFRESGFISHVKDWLKRIKGELFTLAEELEISEIIGKMKCPHSSTVLVAHADVCRGFEWPTVIRVNL